MLAPMMRFGTSIFVYVCFGVFGAVFLLCEIRFALSHNLVSPILLHLRCNRGSAPNHAMGLLCPRHERSSCNPRQRGAALDPPLLPCFVLYFANSVGSNLMRSLGSFSSVE